MTIKPELLLRTSLVDEYKEHAILATIEDLQLMLEDHIGTWWNAYSQEYGVTVREFPYEARNGFFIDVDQRVCTHRFESKGIVRRDKILQDKAYAKIVPPPYRKTWFDLKDATRTYSVLISDIYKLDRPIRVENFGLFNSWGKVSSTDKFHHPRLIKPTWDNMDIENLE